MSPKVQPRHAGTMTGRRSSFEEFRSAHAAGRETFLASPDELFWKYMTSRANAFADAFPGAEGGPVSILAEPAEQRVLSKATNAAGGFTVPQDFDSMIVSARRARAVIPNLAREIVTATGVQLPVAAATAHGVATWTAENAGYTPSDDTFAQTVLGAHKATTKTIVSEELAQDADADFDEYLAD